MREGVILYRNFNDQDILAKLICKHTFKRSTSCYRGIAAAHGDPPRSWSRPDVVNLRSIPLFLVLVYLTIFDLSQSWFESTKAVCNNYSEKSVKLTERRYKMLKARSRVVLSSAMGPL